MLKKRNLIVLTVITLVSIQTITSQCAMCKAVLETGDVSMAEGVNNGISYLMVFPYLVLAQEQLLSMFNLMKVAMTVSSFLEELLTEPTLFL